MFPCEFPVTPSMRLIEDRVNSFNNWSFTRATPQMVAEAGFFAHGVRDRVKCFYCNGGLQNWGQKDDPWEEHAKWYPTCEFLLQQRGPEYIHTIVARFPNINRPILNSPGKDLNSRSENLEARTGKFRNLHALTEKRLQQELNDSSFNRRKCNTDESNGTQALVPDTSDASLLAKVSGLRITKHPNKSHSPNDEERSVDIRLTEDAEPLKVTAEPTPVVDDRQGGVEVNHREGNYRQSPSRHSIPSVSINDSESAAADFNNVVHNFQVHWEELPPAEVCVRCSGCVSCRHARHYCRCTSSVIQRHWQYQ